MRRIKERRIHQIFEGSVLLKGAHAAVECFSAAALVITSNAAINRLVTALGLLPLAVGMGDPGREVEGPMAAVILGRLMTSMVLNLLVLPTLALAFGQFDRDLEGAAA